MHCFWLELRALWFILGVPRHDLSDDIIILIFEDSRFQLKCHMSGHRTDTFQVVLFHPNGPHCWWWKRRKRLASQEKCATKTSRRTFFRACVFTIFFHTFRMGSFFSVGFYNVFLVPCIVLVSEMLSFTMVTKFNYFLLWKLHRFVLYEVVSKASRGSLLQQRFIRFLVFFNPMFSENEFFLNAANAPLWTRVTLQVWTCVKYVPKQSIP